MELGSFTCTFYMQADVNMAPKVLKKFTKKVAAKKITEKEKVRPRNWTGQETKLFADILADDENNFCECLEHLALKKSANNELFASLKSIFDSSLSDEDFKELNELATFLNEDGEVVPYEPLDTSIVKLRRKYTSLKAEWRKIDDKESEEVV